jgi:predicted pyridoxine 5'-phosphate oxidase superfamily flavin-nucleotide-binding protein
MMKVVAEIIKTRDFINVATCDKKGRPNGVSKLIVKVEGNTLVLVDYAISRTYVNLKGNPVVSLSFFDPERLKGYQVNGRVDIIESGAAYEQMKTELAAKEVSLATERIIHGMTRGKPHDEYAVGMTHRFVFFRIMMEEVVEISYSGEIKRDSVIA